MRNVGVLMDPREEVGLRTGGVENHIFTIVVAGGHGDRGGAPIVGGVLGTRLNKNSCKTHD